MKNERYVLLSVYNKEGIAEFARELLELGWKVVSSGGTAKVIADAGLEVLDVAELVGGEAILGHRVVTLSRELHAGLLSTDSKEDVAELEKLGIPRIDLVCVDMYPLAEEIESGEATYESVIEKTDVGGPTMLRAAAKGERIVICDAADRPRVIKWLKDGEQNGESFRHELAAKAEYVVSNYVLNSAQYHGDGKYAGMIGERNTELRYGENGRQSASFYETSRAKDDPYALANFSHVEGEAMSFINMTDMDRLVETMTRISAGFQENFGSVPYIAIAVKHGNTCGAAIGDDQVEATKKMVEGDPEAIMGGSILTNFEITEEIAEILRTHKMEGGKRILDCLFAPDISDDAVKVLKRKGGKCRMWVNPHIKKEGSSLDVTDRMRPVRGGFIIQSGDTYVIKYKKCTGWEKLSEQEQQDAVLGWGVGSTSNSNTIILVKNGMQIGRGVGQSSRVMAAKISLLYAENHEHDTKDAIAYSDSFFPFPDGPMVLADAGINIICATSGSIRDDDVQKACEDRGVKLLLLPDSEARGFFGH